MERKGQKGPTGVSAMLREDEVVEVDGGWRLFCIGPIVKADECHGVFNTMSVVIIVLENIILSASGSDD